MKQQEWGRQFPQSSFLWVAAIIIIGFNLRPAITSVGPLLGTIRDDIGLSNWSAGLITSLPLLAFAGTSPFAAKLGRRFGNVLVVLSGLIFLFVGIGIRSVPTTVTLFLGTFLIGVSIAVLNVLLPAIIKEKFPDKAGCMTSLYTTSMAILAATASGVSVPLAKGAGIGWELSLGTWGILTIIGIAIWFTVAKREEQPNHESVEAKNTSAENTMLRSPLAWQVTVFMGMQSLVFYTIVSWLPAMMEDFGFSTAASGWLLSYLQFISLPSTFFAPILAERFKSQKGIVLVIGLLLALGFAGLLIGGPLALIVLWVTIIGLSSGATISLSLFLLNMRARTSDHAGQLSGMAQSIGYIFAAVGPLLVGLLYDLTHTWNGPLIALIVVALILTVSGVGAGRNKYVLED